MSNDSAMNQTRRYNQAERKAVEENKQWKFVEYMEKGDDTARFLLLEARGDRALFVEIHNCRNMSIRPTYVFQMDEMVRSN